MKRFEPVSVISGPCVVLDRDHIDTDQIIPARFLSRTRAEGFAGLLFHDFLPAEQPTGDKHLRDQMHNLSDGPKVLIAGENFGCGSSREHAVWALLDNGFKAVIAKSFGDIFYGNAVNNGLLPAKVEQGLPDLVCDLALGDQVTIDLQQRLITAGGAHACAFQIDDFFKNMLSNGAQEIDMTLSLKQKIEAFERRHAQTNPWLQKPNLDISN